MNLKPAIDLIRHWEGFRSHAYYDTGGVLTIGYGTIKGVRKGQVCTEPEARAWLNEDIATIRVPAIQHLLKVPQNNNEICALVSFVYNVGVHGFANSTMLRMINAKEPHYKVADQFLRWVRDNGRVIQGLVNRRKEERGLYLSPVAGVMTEGEAV